MFTERLLEKGPWLLAGLLAAAFAGWVVAPAPRSTATASVQDAQGAPVRFETHLRPFFEQYCLDCHGERKRGGLDLRAYSEAASLTRSITAITEHVRSRIARQICEANVNEMGFIPLMSNFRDRLFPASIESDHQKLGQNRQDEQSGENSSADPDTKDQYRLRLPENGNEIQSQRSKGQQNQRKDRKKAFHGSILTGAMKQ